MLDMLLFSFILVIIFFKKMKVASFVVGDVNLGGKHLYVVNHGIKPGGWIVKRRDGKNLGPRLYCCITKPSKPEAQIASRLLTMQDNKDSFCTSQSEPGF